ncbi:MAG: phosphoribosylformylglycinamidine cyclo-ligase, partial [Candidatus Omnitrophica bacterium]|nr:phosphoribosylformylglycinamidine cyclo-ligase [Candidatus Omnitrophota bacterium]
AGDRIKKRIAQAIGRTHSERVLHKEGAFGALFSLAGISMNKPVLVSSVDGVGTKVKLAVATGRHTGIGRDLVNHSINDILTCGARPLFFLDYFACAKQDDNVVLQLIEGMSDACKEAGMALIGGETAQMPDVYAPDEYDLAACIVGIVDEDQIIDGRSIQPGDVLVGIPSSGLHTNGYTLARKVLLDEKHYKLDETLPGFQQSLGEALLTPHRSYLSEVMNVREKIQIRGIAHITGGGFEGNISRILPDGCQADIDASTWKRLPIFDLIQEAGSISDQEMHRVFNMGVGLVIIVRPDEAQPLCSLIPGSVCIGEITAGSGVKLTYPK